jgi:hypothetical protein
MTKNNNIHIKLEICKDENSHELRIMTHFDSNAPNFFKDENSFLWEPTVEEKDFINEAFDLIPTGRMPISPPKELSPESPTPEIPETPEVPHPEEKVVEKPRGLPSPFGNSGEEVRTPPSDLPPLEEKTQQEPPVFESTEEEKVKTEDVNPDKKGEDVFVEADDVAIDEALKRHEEDDNSIVEADENTIIEKVLSQKKKGKWSKE